eukprot:gb/GEZN01002299.1/.p1 GENE.gb/GEZN01002299.1/~~gb/GEZN01002299.1/.p1  ORF type:complete len:747 (+),score=155.76 gb/GEZN01002299.1/:48-2243(+)
MRRFGRAAADSPNKMQDRGEAKEKEGSGSSLDGGDGYRMTRKLSLQMNRDVGAHPRSTSMMHAVKRDFFLGRRRSVIVEADDSAWEIRTERFTSFKQICQQLESSTKQLQTHVHGVYNWMLSVSSLLSAQLRPEPGKSDNVFAKLAHASQEAQTRKMWQFDGPTGLNAELEDLLQKITDLNQLCMRLENGIQTRNRLNREVFYYQNKLAGMEKPYKSGKLSQRKFDRNNGKHTSVSKEFVAVDTLTCANLDYVWTHRLELFGFLLSKFSHIQCVVFQRGAAAMEEAAAANRQFLAELGEVDDGHRGENGSGGNPSVLDFSSKQQGEHGEEQGKADAWARLLSFKETRLKGGELNTSQNGSTEETAVVQESKSRSVVPEAAADKQLNNVNRTAQAAHGLPTLAQSPSPRRSMVPPAVPHLPPVELRSPRQPLVADLQSPRTHEVIAHEVSEEPHSFFTTPIHPAKTAVTTPGGVAAAAAKSVAARAARKSLDEAQEQTDELSLELPSAKPRRVPLGNMPPSMSQEELMTPTTMVEPMVGDVALFWHMPGITPGPSGPPTARRLAPSPKQRDLDAATARSVSSPALFPPPIPDSDEDGSEEQRQAEPSPALPPKRCPSSHSVTVPLDPSASTDSPDSSSTIFITASTMGEVSEPAPPSSGRRALPPVPRFNKPPKPAKHRPIPPNRPPPKIPLSLDDSVVPAETYSPPAPPSTANRLVPPKRPPQQPQRRYSG